MSSPCPSRRFRRSRHRALTRPVGEVATSGRIIRTCSYSKLYGRRTICYIQFEAFLLSHSVCFCTTQQWVIRTVLWQSLARFGLPDRIISYSHISCSRLRYNWYKYKLSRLLCSAGGSSNSSSSNALLGGFDSSHVCILGHGPLPQVESAQRYRLSEHPL